MNYLFIHLTLFVIIFYSNNIYLVKINFLQYNVAACYMFFIIESNLRIKMTVWINFTRKTYFFSGCILI